MYLDLEVSQQLKSYSYSRSLVWWFPFQSEIVISLTCIEIHGILKKLRYENESALSKREFNLCLIKSIYIQQTGYTRVYFRIRLAAELHISADFLYYPSSVFFIESKLLTKTYKTLEDTQRRLLAVNCIRLYRIIYLYTHTHINMYVYIYKDICMFIYMCVCVQSSG